MPARRRKYEPPDDPVRFEEAIEAFRKRVPVSEADWDAMTTGQRERAFKVAGVAQADMVQQVYDSIASAVEHGVSFGDFRAEVGAALEAAWGGPDPARVETVFRTNVQAAYNAGRHKVFSAPAVRRARPYLRFDAVGDHRTSDICAELDGTVLPADDPFWKTHTPPLHFSCRSSLVPLTDGEAEDEGIEDEAPDVDPDEGFGDVPAEDGEDWNPNLVGYDPEIREILAGRLK